MKALLTAAFVFIASVAGAADWEATIKVAQAKIVRLEMLTAETEGAKALVDLSRRADAGKGVCSGVVFNITQDGTAEVVTAAHCVAHEPTQKLDLTVNGRDGLVQMSNGLLDLAIVTFDAKHEDVMQLAPAMPGMGADIAVLGFPFGIKKLAAQFGQMAQPFNDETETSWLNVDLIFGDSGGAAIDAQGRLIGINSRIYSAKGVAHMAAVVPVDAVADFIHSYHKAGRKKK